MGGGRCVQGTVTPGIFPGKAGVTVSAQRPCGHEPTGLGDARQLSGARASGEIAGGAAVMFVLVLFFMLAAVSHFGHVGQGAAAVAWGGSLVAPVGACTCMALRRLGGRGGHQSRELTGHCGARLAGA